MYRHFEPGGRMYAAAGTSGVNILSHWTSSAGISSWSVLAANGRTTGSCLRLTSPASANALVKTLDSQATWGAAFAFRDAAMQGAGTPLQIASFLDAGSSQVNLQVNPDGTLAVARAGTVLGTTSAAISINTWYHVEIKTTVHPSAGTAQVWLNGVSRLSLTGLNTRSTGNATANQFAIGPVLNNQNVGTTFDYDDVIVYDGQTTDAFGNPAMTGPVGDRGLSVRALTADGNYTQFTPNSGTAHFSRLNEATPDGDTTYVDDATVGHRDSFAVAALGGAVTGVSGKMIAVYGRKTDVGARQAGAFWRIGSTDYDHPTAIDLLDTYQYHSRFADSDPSTAAAWGLTNAGAAEVGVKVVS